MKMTRFTDSEYTYLYDLDLDVIKERVEKTTGGEWILDNESDDRPYIVDIWFDGEENGHVEVHKYGAATESADAEFIAHARQDVPALIAEVERLRVVEKQAISAIEGLIDGKKKLRTENERLEDGNEQLRGRLGAAEELLEVRYILLEEAQENIEHLEYVLKKVQLEVEIFGKVRASKARDAKRAKEISEFIDRELGGDDA